MSLPLGYYRDSKASDQNLVCRLNKSIYGLKQAFGLYVLQVFSCSVGLWFFSN